MGYLAGGQHLDVDERGAHRLGRCSGKQRAVDGAGPALGGSRHPGSRPEAVREFKVPVVEELPGNGHVVATITYLIDPQRAEGFKLQTRDSRRSLLRQGATGRELLRDMNKPGHHAEQIVDDS